MDRMEISRRTFISMAGVAAAGAALALSGCGSGGSPSATSSASAADSNSAELAASSASSGSASASSVSASASAPASKSLIVPFNSHEGSGNGGTYSDLREMTGATVLDGLAIRGGDVPFSLGKIDTWYAGLGL